MCLMRLVTCGGYGRGAADTKRQETTCNLEWTVMSTRPEICAVHADLPSTAWNGLQSRQRRIPEFVFSFYILCHDRLKSGL